MIFCLTREVSQPAQQFEYFIFLCLNILLFIIGIFDIFCIISNRTRLFHANKLAINAQMNP